MRTYPKRQPVWRNERFPRMQGFLDAIFRKVELRPDKDGPHCRGGWFERQRRRLQAFEAAVEQSLYEQMRPQLDAYRAACREPGTALSSPGNAPQSTAQVRAMREQARRAAQAGELRASLTGMIEQAACTIRQAYNDANVAAARYAKATRFQPLEQEIPRFGPPAFDAGAVARRLGLAPEQKEETA